MKRKRRSLVLSTESARHPFRARLPVGALEVDFDGWSEVAPPARRPWRDVLNTYVATFVMMTVFIA